MFIIFLFSQQKQCVWFNLSPFVDCFFASFVFSQTYVLPSLCFCNCYFHKMLLHFFVVKFILVIIFFGTMVDVLMKEAKLVVVVDDLDFEIWDVAFEANVFYRYGTFDQIENIKMEDLGYAHLHCDLLNNATLTTITLKVKLPHIYMHEQHW